MVSVDFVGNVAFVQKERSSSSDFEFVRAGSGASVGEFGEFVDVLSFVFLNLLTTGFVVLFFENVLQKSGFVITNMAMISILRFEGVPLSSHFGLNRTSGSSTPGDVGPLDTFSITELKVFVIINIISTSWHLNDNFVFSG